MIAARAVTFVAPRRVELRRVQVEPAPGRLVVRTRWSGISGGSESLAFRGDIDPDVPLDETIGALGATFRFPFRYGYSCVGEIERGVGDLEHGRTVFAFHPHQDVIAVDPADAVAVDGVDGRLATLFPLVETGLQVALDAGPVADEHVLVFGLGAVGILSALMLHRGGARVLGVEPSTERRGVAASAGIESVTPADARDAVTSMTGGRGIPVAVDSSGNPRAPRAALPLLAHEGTLLVASWYGRNEVPLPLGAEFHRRRLQIRSTQVSSIPSALAGRWPRDRRRREAAALLDQLPLKLLATHAFPFAQAQRAFEAVEDGRDGLVHAALRYG